MQRNPYERRGGAAGLRSRGIEGGGLRPGPIEPALDAESAVSSGVHSDRSKVARLVLAAAGGHSLLKKKKKQDLHETI